MVPTFVCSLLPANTPAKIVSITNANSVDDTLERAIAAQPFKAVYKLNEFPCA
jgi:hypothetical protein